MKRPAHSRAIAVVAILAFSACGEDPLPEVGIVGLSTCNGDAFFAVSGSGDGREVLVLRVVGGELSPTCVVVANDSISSAFVEQIDSGLECPTNGFSDPIESSPGGERVSALVCGRHRRDSQLFLVEARSRAAIPFSFFDAEMMDAARSWLTAESSGGPWALRLRLGLQASVTGERGLVRTAQVFIDLKVCPGCSGIGLGGG